MRWDRNSVREGMFVTSTGGERIGKVIRRDVETFVVEKGTLFPKDYELRYDHITGVDDGAITYTLGEAAQREERSSRPQGIETRATTTAAPAAAAPLAAAATATAAASGPRPVATAPAAATPIAQRPLAAKSPPLAEAGDNEVRIPLMQEELEIEKVPHESGHVRIHKGVRTEERHFTVPVRREEIVIEHVTAFAGGAGTGEAGIFEERVVDIALHEEEIRVTKRPVLREEIVVRTVAHSVEKEATATLRHEEADVEDTRKAASGAEEARASAAKVDNARSDEARRDDGYNAPGNR